MIIMACHDLESPLEMLDAIIFEDIMSIFITYAILKLIQGMMLFNLATSLYIYKWQYYANIMKQLLSLTFQIFHMIVSVLLQSSSFKMNDLSSS